MVNLAVRTDSSVWCVDNSIVGSDSKSPLASADRHTPEVGL